MKAPNKFYNGMQKVINGTTFVLLDQDNALSVPYIRQWHIESEQPTDDEIQRAADCFFEGDPDRLYLPETLSLGWLQFVTYTDTKTEYLVYDSYFCANASEYFTNEVIQKGLKLLWQFLTNHTKHFNFNDNKVKTHDDAKKKVPSIWFRGGQGYSYTIWYAKCAAERKFFKDYRPQ